MIHVWDQDFNQKVEDNFHEAYMTHTSTPPNYQIVASLDIGRRQVELEGFELVQKQIEMAIRDHPERGASNLLRSPAQDSLSVRSKRPHKRHQGFLFFLG